MAPIRGPARRARGSRQLLQRAAAGTGGAILVAGEAGIGKSRLVAEFETRARAAGAVVLTGECVELAEGELAFSPIISALRRVMEDGEAIEPCPARSGRRWRGCGRALVPSRAWSGGTRAVVRGGLVLRGSRSAVRCS
ncbi:MAG: AAA family ATPase [Solirubrobacterales bacterium]|nr:AAA family ATPase [Solirubrobacterales bacterium]